MSRPVFRSRWEKMFGRVESPIEATFLEAFCPMAIEHGFEVGRRSRGAGTIVVQPQKWHGGYRLQALEGARRAA